MPKHINFFGADWLKLFCPAWERYRAFTRLLDAIGFNVDILLNLKREPFQ